LGLPVWSSLMLGNSVTRSSSGSSVVLPVAGSRIQRWKVDPAFGVGPWPGAHPAVAVPLGAAVGQAYAVQHARAAEPMAGCDARLRVVAVAEVSAVQLRRQCAVHSQLVGGDLVGHGFEVTADVRRWPHGESFLETTIIKVAALVPLRVGENHLHAGRAVK
jgi:hypothetical protein